MTSAPANDRPAGKPKSNWRRWVAAGLLSCVFLSAGYITYRCLTGPVQVPFVAHFMASQASQGPATLSIFDASVDFTDPEGMRVVVRDAHLKVDGDVPVEIILPRVEAPVSVAALLSGEVSFNSLLLDRPEVQIGLKGGGTIPEMDELSEAVNRVSDIVDESFARRQLEHVTIENGSVSFTGQLARKVEGIDAEIRRAPTGELRAAARVAGKVGPWEIELLRTAPDANADRRIAVLASSVTLAELLDLDVTPGAGKGFGQPFEVKVDTRLSPDGEFKATNIVARTVSGWVQLGRTTVSFDDVALSLVWNADTRAIEVTRSHAVNGNTQIYFRGQIIPPENGERFWDLKLATDFAQFGSSDIPLPPMLLEEAELVARVDPGARSVLIDRLAVSNGKSKAFGAGSVDIARDGPYLAFVLSGTDIPVALAKQVWPITLVPPARKWIIERIKDGRIDTVSLTAAVRPPAFDQSDPDPGWSGDDVTVDLSFSNGRIAPVGDVPDVSSLSGTLRVANEVLRVEAADAEIKVAGRDNIRIPTGSFEILNLPLRTGKIGVLDVDLQGGVRQLGDVVNSAPFRVLDRAGLGDEGVSGTADLNIAARFPIEEDIQVEDVSWKATAVSDNFSAEKPIKGQTIRNADVTLTADPSQVSIAGNGVLNGLNADIDLVIPLNDSNVAARQGVVVDATAAQLKERGIDLTDFVSGDLKMTIDETEAGQNFSINLASAALKLDALGWKKAKGVPAEAAFLLVENEEERRVENFQLTSDSVNLEGGITLTLDGEVKTASFSRFQLREGDAVSLSIQRSANGRYKVALDGDTFDARGLIRQLRQPGGGSSSSGFAGGLSIAANISKVTGFNGGRLDDFAGTLSLSGSSLTRAELSASVDGRAPLTFSVQPAGSGRYVDGKFEDTGALLRFLDLYARMRGGNGQLAVTMSDDEVWDGSFHITDLSIVEDPAIRQLGRGVRLTDRRDGSRIVANAAAAGSGQASFDTMDMQFRRDGDTLTLTRGALQGAVIGGTVSGTVNLKTQRMDLTGTFVPIYALNNFFANIPLLGFALGGGSGEGLLGVTYKLSGPLVDPVLTVNPISAIAPGIFRKMFEFQ
ncbi:AsmA-like protein [Roseibium hamelinense]|uniref:AsmA-like protein n=1 Tax=Roseibium hamelinense TaxID=150831 RepID=A0A562TGP9_9HYPH|nr:AsmA-like C-terminal domain-containing protein [Roseibium hamelinense]TWI92797.1 AsmA-like protein [Roseibium hamelinense]